MTVTSVEKYKGETMCVIFDGDKRTYLHRELVSKYSLKPLTEITHDELTEILYASELRRASIRAMYLINERDYSYIELFEKLSKNYDEDICYEVADKMAQKGFINDRRYASQIVYSYMECKRYGPKRVRQELYKRGIRGSLAEEALEEYADGTFERLCSVIEQKYSWELCDKEDLKAVNKVKNALVRLGYDYDDINAAVREFLEDN